MKNESKIEGDGNIVFQGTKKSKISINKEKDKQNQKRNFGLLGIVIAVLGLIATIIIGWGNIIQFFTK